jgi:hypothetical protein
MVSGFLNSAGLRNCTLGILFMIEDYGFTFFAIKIGLVP